MPFLRDFFSPRARLLVQERRISTLEQEVEKLQAQNDSMRDGMRRCVSCEYRIDYKMRQDQSQSQSNEHDNQQEPL